MAIGISVATVATIGVASTLVANAATEPIEYRFTVAEGTDYSAWANAHCGAGSEFLKDWRIEPAGPGEVTLIFTCQQP